MSKRTRSVRHSNTIQEGVLKQQIEHTEVSEDNFNLINPDLIRELNDPAFLDWAKKRYEKEQEHRHAFDDKRVKILSKIINGELIINLVGMFFALFIVVCGMYFSYLLLINNNVITGSVFAGSTVLSVIYLFITRGRKNNNGTISN